ncbi:MAG: hypothetical protein V2G42_05100 [bacterium JZ-2024 1]
MKDTKVVILIVLVVILIIALVIAVPKMRGGGSPPAETVIEPTPPTAGTEAGQLPEATTEGTTEEAPAPSGG